LPFDKTGDWFYHTVEIASFVAVSIALLSVFSIFINSYEEKFDRFGNFGVPSVAGVIYAVIPCLLLAVFIHP
jgi:ER lumen protein retaining receptor